MKSFNEINWDNIKRVVFLDLIENYIALATKEDKLEHYTLPEVLGSYFTTALQEVEKQK